MHEVILKPCRVKIQARTGKQIGPQILGRWDQREVDFPEISIHAVSSEVSFIPKFKHALILENGSFDLRQSLVSSLNQRHIESVETSWRNAIANESVENFVVADEPVYICYNEGSGTWGHWVVHNMPRAVLFKRYFPNGKIVLPAGYQFGKYKTCLDLLKKTGFSDHDIIFLQKDQALKAPGVYHVDLPYANGLAHPIVMEIFDDLRRSFDCRPVLHGYSFVRRVAESRGFSNQDSIESELKQNGVNIFSNAGDVDGQIINWNSSSGFLGILGSDFTNILLSETAEQLFLVSPVWFGDTFFYGLAAQMGVEWNEFSVPEENLTDLREPKRNSVFYVDPASIVDFMGIQQL